MGEDRKYAPVQIGKIKFKDGEYYNRASSSEWLFVGCSSLLEDLLHSSNFNTLVFALILQCRNVLIQPIVYL